MRIIEIQNIIEYKGLKNKYDKYGVPKGYGALSQCDVDGCRL